MQWVVSNQMLSRACYHYADTQRWLSNEARQGAQSEVWLIQISDAQRRMASLKSQPEGTGPFFPMTALHFHLCMAGTLRSVRLVLQKNGLRRWISA